MGRFDTLIKELEQADRLIKDLSEENKKLKIDTEWAIKSMQAQREERNKMAERVWDLEREQYQHRQEIEKLQKEVIHFAKESQALRESLGANFD